MDQEPNIMEPITIDVIESIIVEQGYFVELSDENILKITDNESGISIQAVLEDNVLFFTVPCINVDRSKISPEIMWKMLDAENGISTSSLQLYDAGNNQVTVTLNNFCKLLSLGCDDEDDILSCIEFLLADVVVASEMLSELAG